jgi:preprotein translocase subunit YajC
LELLVLAIFIAIMFWFVLIRPQQRARRQQQEMVQTLEIGDEVISVGGLVGRVTRLPEDDGWIGFELSPSIETKLLTVAISHRLPAEEVKEDIAGDESRV